MCGQDTPGLKAHPSFQHLASTPSLIVLQAFGELQYWFPHPKFEYLDLTRVGISAVTIHWLPKKTNSNATRCLCSWSSEWDSGGGFSICLGHVLMYPRTNCLICNWMEPIEPLGPCQKLHPELSDSPGLSKVNGKNTTGCYNTMRRFALEFTCNWTKSLVHVPKDGTALMLVLQWYFARKNWCHQQASVSSMTCLAMPAKVYMITHVNIASMEVFVDLTLNAEKNMYFDFVCPNSEFSKDIPFDFWLNMKSCCETDWACKLKHVKTEVDSLDMLGVKLRQLQHAILEAAWCKDRFLHVAGCPVLIWQAWMSSLQLMSSYSADTPIDLLTPIQMLAMFTGIQNKA